MPLELSRTDARMDRIVKVIPVENRSDRYSVREVIDGEGLGPLVKKWYAVPTVPLPAAASLAQRQVDDWLLFIYKSNLDLAPASGFGLGPGVYSLDGFFPKNQRIKLLGEEVDITRIFRTTNTGVLQAPTYTYKAADPTIDVADISYRIGNMSPFADDWKDLQKDATIKPVDLDFGTYILSAMIGADGNAFFMGNRFGAIADFDANVGGEDFAGAIRGYIQTLSESPASTIDDYASCSVGTAAFGSDSTRFRPEGVLPCRTGIGRTDRNFAAIRAVRHQGRHLRGGDQRRVRYSGHSG